MSDRSPKRALGLVQDETLRREIMRLLPDYEIFWELGLKGAIHTAADLRPAFMLVDMDQNEKRWRDLVVALQSSPATRRIPMLGITAVDGEMMMKQAARASLSGPLHRDALSERMPDWVARHARVWDESYYDSLQSGCGDELPEMTKKGIALFNNHEFWDAHEALEEAWIAVRPDPVGEVYRSILQVGVAYYQIQRKNYQGAIKMFLRAVQWLDPLPDECQGIDIAQFKQDVAASRAALEALGAMRIAEFDTLLFKPVPFVTRT